MTQLCKHAALSLGENTNIKCLAELALPQTGCACGRVCVDLCSNMGPGEGLLVGSFARALFLVHSESAQSAYISSRPFRVNAGAVSPVNDHLDGCMQ